MDRPKPPIDSDGSQGQILAGDGLRPPSGDVAGRVAQGAGVIGLQNTLSTEVVRPDVEGDTNPGAPKDPTAVLKGLTSTALTGWTQSLEVPEPAHRTASPTGWGNY